MINRNVCIVEYMAKDKYHEPTVKVVVIQNVHNTIGEINDMIRDLHLPNIVRVIRPTEVEVFDKEDL